MGGLGGYGGPTDDRERLREHLIQQLLERQNIQEMYSEDSRERLSDQERQRRLREIMEQMLQHGGIRGGALF
jgi:hypothetical protein